MDPKRLRFRLGLFVLTAAVLLAVLILLFGGSAGRLFTRQNEYTIKFTDAPGIAVGTPVRRSGVKIGSVTKVELDDKTGTVIVRIGIDKQFTVYDTDQPIISQDLLSRDTTIDLVKRPPSLAPPVPAEPKGDVRPVSAIEMPADLFAAGQPAPPAPPAQLPPANGPGNPLPPGSTIIGGGPGGPQSALGQFQTVLPALEQALNAIRRSAERMEQAVPQLDAGAREFTALGRAIREAVPDIRKTNDELQALLRSARGVGPELRRTNDELQVTLRNFGSVAERLDVFLAANQNQITRAVDQTTDVLQRLNNVLSDENQKNFTATLRAMQTASVNFESISRNANEFLTEGTKTTRQVQGSISQADRVLRNLDTATTQLTRALGGVADALAPLGHGGEGGTIQKFFTDPSLYNNLNQAACMITTVMPRLDRILRDVEVFADKIARHPESLGVRGAVSPNSGLKESPTAPQGPTYRQFPP
jgi:phospholipid/cholesterol/gamma-HCH transport system substrate-binding protein